MRPSLYPKILFITSFYSALQSSVKRGKWQPTGMPAITKLFEKLESKNIYFDSILINEINEERKSIKINGFRGYFFVIPITSIVRIFNSNKLFRIFSRFIKIMRTIQSVLKIYKGSEYDIIYVDRANVITGAYFVYFTRAKVVLRLHGITELYPYFSRKYNKIINPILSLSYKAPFSYIIGSEDGTPLSLFLENFTNKKIPKRVYLNGVDKQWDNKINILKKHNLQEDKPIVLFVGRLVEDKGIVQFIESIELLHEVKDLFNVIIIGDGVLSNFVLEHTKDLTNVRFLGRIPLGAIYDYYYQSNIYVSLNSLGNLSNTVLEAINAGNCIITFSRDKDSFKDFSTEKYLGEIALFISRDNCVKDLSSQIKMLITNRKLLYRIKTKTELFAKTFLSDWTTRINEEIELIKDV